jgi:ATP-binding cassette subfamily B protein
LTTVGTKLRRAAEQMPYLPRALRLVWDAAGNWTGAWVVLLAIQGLLPIATVWLMRSLVDGLVAGIRAGGAWTALRPAAVSAGLMAAVLLAGEVLRSLAGWVRAAQAELVQDHIQSIIHRQSIAADLAFYDSADFYDHLHRARAEASHRPVALLESLGSLLQNGITLVAMGALLVRFGVWLPAALLVSTLPAFLAVMRSSIEYHAWRRTHTAAERRTWYFDWLLTTGANAAEVRLFGLGEHFRGAYQALRARLRTERMRLARRQGLAELGAGASALAVTGAAMVWMAWRTVRGLATLGDLALFYQAFQQGLRLMRGMLDNAGQLYSNILFLGDLFEFLALEPRVTDPPKPLAQDPSTDRLAGESAGPAHRPASGIRFHHVTFRYPGSGRLALDDFSLEIPAGRITAVVGPNGAGKSTLIKLLCRFYDPEAGHVELDGADLRDLPLGALRRGITVLFQEPVHYSETAARNIALGDLAAEPGAEAIEDAARAAGADAAIGRLPKGYENLLGRWFDDGAELSTGEWQRVALARAFLRRAPLIVLDEPTSAMDPWAEADWLKRFRRLAEGRTALIITHRFTTAMFADVIHVMDAGRIIESGSHAELIGRGSRYAAGWAAQGSS